MDVRRALIGLTLSMLLGNGVAVAADYEKGLQEYQSGAFKAALEEWVPLAEQGNAAAQAAIGTMYINGEGVSKNMKVAVKWYTLAAAQGNARGQNNLAVMYQFGKGVKKNDKTAVKWYTLAAEQGDEGAQSSLELLLSNSIGNTPTANVSSGDDADNPCTETDYEKAAGLYNPVDAYNFELMIRSAVEAEDTSALFDLIKGELWYGPRRSFAIKSKFEQVFPSDFKDKVLSSSPACRPHSYRGFSTGGGAVWYDAYEDGSFGIFSIPSAKQESVTGIDAVGWPHNNSVLPSSCFSTKWASSDNYEEYAERFSISDFDDFTMNMGQYFGREITDLNPISAFGSTISLIDSLASCTEDSREHVIKDGYVWYGESYNLRVVGEISIDRCNKLASSLNDSCINSFVVQHNSMGGSIGIRRAFYAYGLFDLPELGLSIVPLVNLGTLNHALNFIDDI